MTQFTTIFVSYIRNFPDHVPIIRCFIFLNTSRDAIDIQDIIVENIRILFTNKIISLSGLLFEIHKNSCTDHMYARIIEYLGVSQYSNFNYDKGVIDIIDGDEKMTVIYNINKRLSDNFLFCKVNRGDYKYVGISTNEKLDIKLEMTFMSNSKYTVSMKGGNYKLYNGNPSNYDIANLLHIYNVEYLMFVDEKKNDHLIYVLNVFSENNDLLCIEFKNNTYTINGGYTIITSENYFGLNRWIYCIPLSFVICKGEKYYMMLIHHKYNKIKITYSQWVDPSAVPHNNVIMDSNVYYVIEISYNFLDLIPNHPHGDDIDYYVYCCIIFQKTDCLRSIFHKYLNTVQKENRNGYVRANVFNNPFQHYFKAVASNDNSEYMRRLLCKAYGSGKYFMCVDEKTKTIHDRTYNDTSLCVVRSFMKDVRTTDLIKYASIDKHQTTLGNKNLILFRKEIEYFFDSYKTCVPSSASRAYISKFYDENKEKIGKLKTDKLIEYDNVLAHNTGACLTDFILKNNKILYDILEIKLMNKFLNDLKLIDPNNCIELKRIYDYVDSKVLYGLENKNEKIRTPDIVVFEILFGAYIRDEQYIIYKTILEEIKKGEYNVQQLLMGLGKTTVIMPLIALHYLLVCDNKFVFF